MAYEPKPFDIAGFELIGYRQVDGTILLGAGGAKGQGTPTADFPKEVTVCGATYTLENIKKNDVLFGPLANAHPGKHIEWGEYV
jgi:hypothetical protein